MLRLPNTLRVSPFARVFTAYIQRTTPPMSVVALAAKLQMTRQTVNQWIARQAVPPIETMLDVLARLDIPLSDLLAAYHKLGVPILPLTPASGHDLWDTFIAGTEAAMRDAGLPDNAVRRRPRPHPREALSRLR